MEGKGIGETVVGILVGGLEVVSVGVLLAIGFHIGAKIIEKVEDGRKLKNPKLAGTRA